MPKCESKDQDAFFKAAFGKAIDFETLPSHSRKHSVESNSNESGEVMNQPPREDFLEVINYASPNYDARRRDMLFPTIASVTTFF